MDHARGHARRVRAQQQVRVRGGAKGVAHHEKGHRVPRQRGRQEGVRLGLHRFPVRELHGLAQRGGQRVRAHAKNGRVRLEEHAVRGSDRVAAAEGEVARVTKAKAYEVKRA